MPRHVMAALTAALALGAAGCAGSGRQVYTPAALRAELLGRTPPIPAADLVVPFELPPAALATAARVVRDAKTDREKIELLVKAMFDPKVFALQNDGSATTTGAEALAARRGNCVAMASIFIGLARSVGLDARYIDASSRVSETHYAEDGSTVHLGHVSALVNTGNDRTGLDFARLGPIKWYRPLDDLEALGHYYNNRGYDLLEDAREEGGAPDWAAAERLFRLAVAVKPGFARAWNNLGIAAARQGRRDDAVGAYREATRLDPTLSAAHANLGAVWLQAGDLPAALRELGRAAELDPKGADIQYNLAVARLRSGDRPGALQALRRAISLRASYPGARALLERLAPGSPGAGGG